MTEASQSDENRDVKTKTTAFQLKMHATSTGQQQTAQTDSVRRSLSPLINCMRLFGLYFGRKARVGCETATEHGDLPVRRCGEWNFARIYASILLVVTWLNACRFAAVSDGDETSSGVGLFTKLGLIPAALASVVFQTAYYIASHTGSLDRVVRQADLSMSKMSLKYGRRTKVVTAVCWLLVAWNLFRYMYQLFTNGPLSDITLTLLDKALPESYLYVIKAVFVVLQLLIVATWVFPQAMISIHLAASCHVTVWSNVYISRFVQLSSSNELHGDERPQQSVPPVERGLRQMY